MTHYADKNTRKYPYPVCGHASRFAKITENPDDENIDCDTCKKWIRKNIWGVDTA